MSNLSLREFAEENGFEILTEDSLMQKYKDEIDENNTVKICGMTYNASRVLEELDPIAFRCGFSDWLDSNEFDEFDGDYMKRSDIDNCESDYETYLDELSNNNAEE